MDETRSNPEKEKMEQVELSDMLLSQDKVPLTINLRAKIQAGEIPPTVRFTVDVDLTAISDPTEIVRITRDIKSLVENRELRDKVESIKVVIKRSQYDGEVINAVSVFRSKCEIIEG